MSINNVHGRLQIPVHAVHHALNLRLIVPLHLLKNQLHYLQHAPSIHCVSARAVNRQHFALFHLNKTRQVVSQLLQ